MEAVLPIVEAAQKQGVTTRPVQVGFFSYSMPGSTGFLAFEVAGKLQRAKEVNGVITRLRGSAWKAFPHE